MHFHEMHQVHERVKRYVKEYEDVQFCQDGDDAQCSKELGSFMKGLLHPDPNMRIGPSIDHPNPSKHASAQTPSPDNTPGPEKYSESTTYC